VVVRRYEMSSDVNYRSRLPSLENLCEARTELFVQNTAYVWECGRRGHRITGLSCAV
jgi:hypothetical protein